MRVAVLAGGRGTRMGAATAVRPKPMVEIGGRPILWHILRHHAHHGLRDFVVALGHRGDVIRDWLDRDDHASGAEWTVRPVDTGADTASGGRVRRLGATLGDEPFVLCWGDGLTDLDTRDLVAFHRAHGRLATVVAAHPPPRFGRLTLDGDRVAAFVEKPHDPSWVNAGMFVLEPGVLQYVDGDDTPWEDGPMQRLAADGELQAYRHEGFWHGMDTPADLAHLQRLWSSGAAPWKVWP